LRRKKDKKQDMNGHGTNNGKSTTKVLVPESPELMMRLAETLMKKHASAGTASPVGEVLTTQIGVKFDLARERHEEGLTYLKKASVALEQRDTILGTRSSGNAAADVSLKFYLQCAAEVIAKENPELLKDFGFSG
jgi:hypothetical protein